MGLSSKIGQALTAREIFDLVKHDLDRVEREISLESVASVDADSNGTLLFPITCRFTE